MSGVVDERLTAASPPFAATPSQIGEWSVVAVAVVIAAFAVTGTYDASSLWLLTVAIAALCVWVVVQDLKTFTIADGAVVSIACLALADRLAAGHAALSIGLDILLTGGSLLAFREIYYRRRGFDGLGLGDVKLGAAGGLLIGATSFAWALLSASLLGLCVVVMTRCVVRPARPGLQLNGVDKLAFGALLAPAIWGGWFVQHSRLLFPSAGV